MGDDIDPVPAAAFDTIEGVVGHLAYVFRTQRVIGRPDCCPRSESGIARDGYGYGAGNIDPRLRTSSGRAQLDTGDAWAHASAGRPCQAAWSGASGKARTDASICAWRELAFQRRDEHQHLVSAQAEYLIRALYQGVTTLDSVDPLRGTAR